LNDRAWRKVELPHDWSIEGPECRPGGQVDLDVYSNCKTVELWLNVVSQGVREVPLDASLLSCSVPYEPGVLKVVGRVEGASACMHELRTAGAARRLTLEADQATFATDKEDVCFATASIVDESGMVVPSVARHVTFSVSGPGRLLAVDSVDLASHELFQTNQRSIFEGRCMALIQSTGQAGEIVLRAATANLPAATCRLVAQPP
jgi:beta-galactosidase